MKNYLKIATLALPLIFGGCEESKEPVRADYNKKAVSVNLGRGYLTLIDNDGCGQVDYVIKAGIGIAEVNDKFKKEWPEIPTMSADVRDAASRVLNAQRDLEFAVDKETFERMNK